MGCQETAMPFHAKIGTLSMLLGINCYSRAQGTQLHDRRLIENRVFPHEGQQLCRSTLAMSMIDGVGLSQRTLQFA